MSAKNTFTQCLAELPDAYTDAYTDDDKRKVIQIVNWLNEGQEHDVGFDNKRSQIKLARASSQGQTTLNAIIRGKYPSSPTDRLNKVIDAIERQSERESEKIGDNPFVETSIYVAVNAACKRAHKYRSFSVVSAFVGTGKTKSLKRYAELHPNTVLIEATPDMNATVMLRELVEKTNAIVHKSHKWARGTKSDMMEAIIANLTGSDKLIILDEAEKTTTQTLEYIRRISDIAKVGVVLSGTEMLQPMIRDPRGRFGQISSRILYWPPVIRGITDNDAKAIVEAALIDEAELTPDIHRAFYEMCDGSARVLAHSLITGVRDYGLRKGNELTANMIYQVGEQLLGFERPIKRRK